MAQHFSFTQGTIFAEALRGLNHTLCSALCAIISATDTAKIILYTIYMLFRMHLQVDCDVLHGVRCEVGAPSQIWSIWDCKLKEQGR